MVSSKTHTKGLAYKRQLYFIVISLFIIFIWSVNEPNDWVTWLLEAGPVILGFFIVVAIYNVFPLTLLAYWLLLAGAFFVLIGAHYTYSDMPLFNLLQDQFHLERNHYDRLGHIIQGFTSAIIFRELLLRTSPLRVGSWLFIVVISMCLAKSVLYEFAEWAAAVSFGQTAHEFLGTQGDEWDAQKDMILALLGSILSLALLSNYHDKQLKKL